MLILGVLVEAVGGVKDKEDQGFPGTPLVDHPLLGLGVLIKEVIRAPCIQLKQELWKRVTNRHGHEEV